MSSREMRWQSCTYTPPSDGNIYNYTPRTFKSTHSIYRFATVWSSKYLPFTYRVSLVESGTFWYVMYSYV